MRRILLPLPLAALMLAAALALLAGPAAAGWPDQYGAWDDLAPALGHEDLPARDEAAEQQGRKASLATLTDWLGTLYDGAMAKLRGDTPAVDAAQRRLALKADPRAYADRGVQAAAHLAPLGLSSTLQTQLGTRTMRQSMAVSAGCGSRWLPHQVSGSVSGMPGRDDWNGQARASWGSACAAGQPGWRFTAAMQDLAHDADGSLGLEYRPRPTGSLGGLSAVRATVTETGGSIGLDGRLDRGLLPASLLPVRSLPVNADVEWQQDGSARLRLGTRLRF
ncbi:hypothetical protein [Oleisolibacter albus]|uniref:hypothetical protein n=1 Tax=Oleisolibacter albus TaxID=2171757 RepID=UPI000DF20680|nr:hypothetical protein [Oleisolibacter albus]